MLNIYKKFIFTLSLAFGLFGFFNVSYGATLLNENFDSYTTGNLLGQGSWVSSSTGGTAEMQVENTVSFTSPNGISQENTANGGYTVKALSTSLTSGQMFSKFYYASGADNGTGAGTIGVGLNTTSSASGDMGITLLRNREVTFDFGNFTGGSCNIANTTTDVLNVDAWNTIGVFIVRAGSTTEITWVINGFVTNTAICTNQLTLTHVVVGSSNNGNVFHNLVYLDNIVVTDASTADGITAILNPAEGTTIGNPLNIYGIYNNGSTYNQIELEIYGDAFSGILEQTIPIVRANGVNLEFNYALQTFLASGNYTIRARLSDDIGVLTPTAWVSNNFIIDGAKNNLFTGQNPSAECGITSIEEIGGCLSNFVTWLFIPNQNQISSFWALGDDLKEKVPFVFFYTIKDNLDAFSTETASSASNVVVNLGSGSIGTFTMLNWSSMKTYSDDLFGDSLIYLIYGIWITFSLYAFYRVIHTLK